MSSLLTTELSAGLTPPAPPLPAPGAYLNVPFATYRAWPAVNKSTLDHIQDGSPLHCRYRMDNPEDETPALIIGRAYHTLTLEGEEAYAKEFAVAPKVDKRTNAGKAEWAAFEAASGGRAILTEAQGELVRALRRGTLDCEDARKFIGSPGDNEVSILWVDAATGLACKARIDMVRESWNSIGDLKTTQEAGREKFTKSISEWGYHRQSAFYLRGAKAVGLPVEYFCIFPVEKDAPHASAAYKFTADAVGAGEEQISRLLETYARCQAMNEWPGYPGGFEDITITPWEMRKIVGPQ